MAKKKSAAKKVAATKRKSKKKVVKKQTTKKPAVRVRTDAKLGSFKLTDVPIKSQDVISRQQGDVVNVIHLQNPDEIYDIDGLAARAWELIDGVKNISEISLEIAALGGFDKNIVTMAFIDFLKDAMEQKLLSLK